MGRAVWLIVMAAFSVPRLVMFLMWLLTDWFERAFETKIWYLVGFSFAPYTTMVYMASMLNNEGMVSGLWTLYIVVAVLFDLLNHILLLIYRTWFESHVM